MTPLPLLLLALADSPCTPPAPSAEPDARTAEAYVQAGEAEWAAGEARAAALAFREALRHEATSSAARAGLARACAVVQTDEALAEASAHLEAGRAREALAALAALAEDSPRADDAALLRALAHLALGDDAAAHAALLPAERAPESAETARLLEAALAVRAGRTGEATALLEGLSGVRDGRVRSSADALLPLLRGDERLRLSAAARTGWDGNLARVPDGASEAGADGVAAVEAALDWTPSGARGPLFGVSALLSKQLSLHAYDAAVADVHAGWRLGWGEAVAGASYSQLGGVPWLAALRVDTAARHVVGDFVLQADYGLRREVYLHELLPQQTAGAYGFSGWRHTASAGGAWWHAPFLVRVGWRGELDRADAAFYSYLEHGPEVGLTLLGRGGASVGLELQAADRRFLAVDPGLGALRTDGVLGAALTASLPMGERWAWVASVQGTRVRSSLAAFTYGRLAGTLALRYTLGVP